MIKRVSTSVVFLTLCFVAPSVANKTPIRHCTLPTDAIDCCNFPKLISASIVQQCIQELHSTDQATGVKRPGPPGGMCLFKCLANGAQILGADSHVDKSLVTKRMATILEGSDNYSAWTDVVADAISTSFQDYQSMGEKEDANVKRKASAQDPTCYSSHGYFLSRFNAELFMVRYNIIIILLICSHFGFVFSYRIVQISKQIHQNVTLISKKFKTVQFLSSDR